MLYASTPHELGRALECSTLMTVGDIAIQASLARKASSAFLNLNRLDFSEKDPAGGRSFCPLSKSMAR